ncbi:MAG: tRNA (adenosine(37)-N6)-dimethylallyltransferase MiaA [Lachnospiraceae bacterium]|nr:tRNA (adenosine(37)-N6)-dimethylallyltransferase MiaA [Lachnospiraceae bacterium]
MKDIVIIAGPTAVGKTDLSIFLAKQIDGEIISADSMQVYKGMDIGTGKITAGEMMGVKHHLIDILDPGEDFNIAMFVKLAKEAIADIRSRGKMPIIVGGTGFYIQALLKDVEFEDEEDSSYREMLYKELEDKGVLYVHNLLKDIDEVSFNEIPVNNSKRVIRALEYYHFHNEPISVHNEKLKNTGYAYNEALFCITNERQILYDNIEKRVDKMLSMGLLNEVKGLLDRGLTEDNVSMKGLGYKEFIPYFKGECTLDEAIYVLKRDTRHFAKRQLTWFRKEQNVIYINKSEFSGIDEILDYMTGIIFEE